MKKIKINNKEISVIKDHAQKAFVKTPQFIDLDAKEMQIACILMGLETYMNSKGLPVDFEIELKKHHDSMPIDEDNMT